MKILYLCNDPGIDLAGKSGAAIHIQSFVRALADIGHQVVVVTCSLRGCKQALEDDLHATICSAPLSLWNRALTQVLRVANLTIGGAMDVKARHELCHAPGGSESLSAE